MSSPTPVSVWWLKKDFRLRDNPALREALKSTTNVVPIFVIEPSAVAAAETSAFHVASWLEAVKHLRASLRKLGGDLLVVNGEVVDTFEQLNRVIPISQVHSHEEVGTLRTFKRDKAVANWCTTRNVAWTEMAQTGVFRRLRDRDSRSKRWKDWMGAGPLPAPSDADLRRCSVPEQWRGIVNEPTGRLSLAEFDLSLTDAQRRHRQRVNEQHAQSDLEDFLFDRGLGYSSGISSPNTAFVTGSRLSTHLAWGTITGRDVYSRTQQRMDELKESSEPDAGKWRRSLNAFRSRLNWRDHFIQRLETEPNMELHSLNRAYDALPTTKSRKRLKAWVNGETGLPLVDACIRYAMTTGFMNFRMRCMITSVACHALRLDWRDIMWPMAQWWADYEPGIHVAQLQMQAGVVGINTLRTYNPAKQIGDHDPSAKFVKRWVPELKKFSAEQIIAHQDDPVSGYIKPIVNWKKSTTEMRAAYFAIRRLPETKELAESVLARHGSRKPPSTGKRKAARKKSVRKE